MKRLLSILILLICAGCLFTKSVREEQECNITFVNKSGYTMIYYVYQLNHELEGCPYPMNRAVGELEVGEQRTVQFELGGIFWVEWKIGGWHGVSGLLAESTETFVLMDNKTIQYNGFIEDTLTE